LCAAPSNASPTCGGGQCGFVCNTSLANCGGTCVDPNSDPNNCGTCGNQCDSGICSNGVCVAVRLGQTCTTCGNNCVDLQSNAAHCGSCSHACQPFNEVCLGGICQPPP